MTILACVDERNGMMFNRRRQSRDLAVCRDILKECSGKELYMTPYSEKLFADVPEAQIRVSEDLPAQAGEGDACFLEDTEIAGFERQIQTVILYRWNRRYPADRYFTLDLCDGAWELRRTEEFRGSSHERITKEVYERIG